MDGYSAKTAYWLTVLATLLGLGPHAGNAAYIVVYPSGSGLYPTIQAAVDAAAVGDTVLAMPGTYLGEGNRGINFRGKNLVLLSKAGAALTIIDCESQDRGFSFLSGETADASVQGFTVIHGTDIGGGVWCENASPQLRNLVIEECSSDSRGGGIRVSYASPLLDGVTVRNCTAAIEGGGMTFYASQSILRNARLEYNHAGTSGGGIVIGSYCSVTIDSVLFEGNSVGWTGGAIYAHGDDGAARITNCRFVGNSAHDGGGIYSTGDTLLVDACRFEGNFAEEDGGGVSLHYSADVVSIANSVFVGNEAHWGGGFHCNTSAYATLSNLTMVGNIATAYGAAISIGGDSGAGADISDCLVAFNGPTVGISVHDWSLSSIRCSNVYGNEGGNYMWPGGDPTGMDGNISENPMFCDLPGGELTLDAASPCLPGNNACGVLMGAMGQGCSLTAVQEAMPVFDRSFLAPNIPNPFNSTTRIRFVLPAATTVDLAIYDTRGRRIATLLEGVWRDIGEHDVVWRGLDDAGRPQPSGVYLCRLDAGGHREHSKLILVQ